MAVQTIYWRGSRESLLKVIHAVPAALAGKVSERADIARAVSARIGNTLLADVKLDFERKAQGMIGEDGNQWAPNTPRTVIRKLLKNKKTLNQKNETGEAFRQRMEEYKKRVREATKKLRSTYVTSSDPTIRRNQEALLRKAVATAVGYYPHEIREEEGDKFKDVLPFSLTQILRDVGLLFNSLSAGVEEHPYSGPDSQYQVFKPVPGSIAVGTNLIYAATHQHGDPTRHIPARPFLPEDGKPLPKEWMLDIIDVLIQAVVELIIEGGKR